MTKNAQTVLWVVENSDAHLTAEEIFFEARKINSKISLATVYNSLKYLSDRDEILKLSFNGVVDRYDRVYRHEHLVCKKCGKISDVKLSDLTEKISKELKEDILSYDLRISYICPDCRKNKKLQ